MTNWVQYEVWAEDDNGHQELIETTASRKEALSVAQRAFNEGLGIVTVHEESSDGNYETIKEFK